MPSAKLSDWIDYGRQRNRRIDDRRNVLRWMNEARARWVAL